MQKHSGGILGGLFGGRLAPEIGIHVVSSRYPRWFWSVSALLSLAAVGLAIWLVIAPQRPKLNGTQVDAVNDTVGEVVQRLNRADTGLQVVAVLPLAHDVTSEVTNRLRATIKEAGVFIDKSASARENIDNILRLDHMEVADLRTAVHRGRDLGVEAVLFGSVQGPVRRSGQTDIRIDFTLARVVDDKQLDQAVLLRDQVHGTYDDTVWLAGSVPIGWKFLIWVGATLALPLLAMPGLRSIVRRRSNAANASALIGLTTIGAMGAFWMMNGRVSDLASAVVFAGAIIAGFLVGLFLLNFALQLES